MLISLAVIFVLFFGRAVPSFTVKAGTNFTESHYLKMDRNLFYRQTVNNCGPYSVMAVINILSRKEKDPELLAEQTGWRIYKNLTFPQGVVNLLHQNGIKTREYVLKIKSDSEKINWIKETVCKNKPVICLIKINHVLHYVTILGYDQNGFMLYDSMQEKDGENPQKTVIDENCVEGNRYYAYDEFMKLWNDGGYKLFFRNWAIACSL